MKLKDQFRFVRQNMKKNKTRVFMTILATAMGCAFLIVLASVGFGLQKSLIKDLMEQRIVTAIDVYGKEINKGEFQQLTDKDVHAFEKIKKVKAVTRRKQLMQAASYEIDNYQTTAETIVTHVPSEVKAGFELSKGRLPKSKDEVVVGYHFVEELAQKTVDQNDLYDEKGQIKEQYKYKKDMIGKKVQLTVKQFENNQEVSKTFEVTVVGITKKPTKEWVFDKNVFISDEILKEIEAFTGTSRGMIKDSYYNETTQSGVTDGGYDQVKIYATNMEAIKGITDKLKEEKYATYSVVDELKQINMVFNIIKIGLIFIGTIAILIASIGIYNTMTMAVTERAPDIGIMKAIGANPKTIKNIFLLESSYIGLIGALIGTVVSYAISFGVNFALPLVIKQFFKESIPEGFMFSHIPWSLPVICFVICYLVTIVSGLRPAKRATQIDVLSAMRREV
ncbi:ABC transporter permease [Bacillus sp. DNRA2]|uniref:ABC transporter permease n=1 Tax=Bacillus sp. DNRA2 TaxID=2723053 RepID=UPI00145F06DB|nr:FtsX-like permease family protein [Bacillus sp. DNRA2]NMD70443.1 ABC transporter permease [Bacillus sp. DNRA2]